jgi:hypothetical protein
MIGELLEGGLRGYTIGGTAKLSEIIGLEGAPLFVMKNRSI